jgi:hypothetical protein
MLTTNQVKMNCQPQTPYLRKITSAKDLGKSPLNRYPLTLPVEKHLKPQMLLGLRRLEGSLRASVLKSQVVKSVTFQLTLHQMKKIRQTFAAALKINMTTSTTATTQRMTLKMTTLKIRIKGTI